MTASVISDWFPAGSRAEPLRGVGQSPTSAANGASKTRLDLQRGWGEYGEVTYTIRPTAFLIEARSARSATPHSPLVAPPPDPCQEEQVPR